MKHTSTVLEPSIPFHTLIKLVDAEDIANDNIRTHDHTLEVHNITKQLQTQTLDSSQQEQLMFTQPLYPKTKINLTKNYAPIVIEQINPQPLYPNNKNKPYKKLCSYCHRTNHSISVCFKKQRDDEDKRDAYAGSKSPQISYMQYFHSRSNNRI